MKPREFERADPLPHRAVGVMKDGGVCLGVYLHFAIKGIPLRELPNPTIDSLVLAKDEWGGAIAHCGGRGRERMGGAGADRPEVRPGPRPRG